MLKPFLCGPKKWPCTSAGLKQTAPHFQRVSINREMCLKSVQKGLKESHSSIFLDICKKKIFRNGAEVCTVVWKWVEKNTTMSLYIVSGVSLPPWSLFVFKGCFSVFTSLFFFFFGLIFESKKWLWSFLFGKLGESLKARQLQKLVCFCVSACVYWFCPGVRRDALLFPLENSWFTQGRTIFTKKRKKKHEKGSRWW